MFKLFVLLIVTSSAVLGNPFRRGGRYLPDGRIIGGEDADIADYPYQLALLSLAVGDLCGAVLISPEWALTAAHCTDDAKDLTLLVRAGSSNSTGGQLVAIDTIYQHEGFAFDTLENDISVLKLSSNVTVANSKPIGLVTGKPEAGKLATVTGWGTTVDNNYTSYPNVLQVVQVPVVDHEDCKKAYADSVVTDGMLCAGFLVEGGKDSCIGDSGGPLVTDGLLAGLISWGDGCGRSGKPGVYTDVFSYLGWIDEIMSSNA